MNKNTIKNTAKKVAKGSLTVTGEIIIGLFYILDDMEFMRSHQGLCQSMGVSQARAYLAESERFQKKHRHAYRRLKKRGWIEERKIGGQMIDILTKDGEIAAIEIALKNLVPKLARDEYWMVAFDFPEITHNARDEFRGILKRIGFVCHQQSVWCINKDVGNGVKRIIGLLGVKKWVRVYRSVEYL